MENGVLRGLKISPCAVRIRVQLQLKKGENAGVWDKNTFLSNKS